MVHQLIPPINLATSSTVSKHIHTEERFRPFSLIDNCQDKTKTTNQLLEILSRGVLPPYLNFAFRPVVSRQAKESEGATSYQTFRAKKTRKQAF